MTLDHAHTLQCAATLQCEKGLMQWDCNAASEYNIHVIIATLLHTKCVLTYMLSTLLVGRVVECGAGARTRAEYMKPSQNEPK